MFPGVAKTSEGSNVARYAPAAVPETWRWVGDTGLLRSIDVADPNEACRSVLALEAVIRSLGDAAIQDVVPGARSVLVMLQPGAEPSGPLTAMLEGPVPRAAPSDEPPLEIPVRYGGDDGPDLESVAEANGLSRDEVVRLHSSATYLVAFIGFSPGFPYLIGMPNRLATPRLTTPRTRVPAGSVGIGGGYTGIYPHATPGGWRLIGRTDVELFDPASSPPALLRPGFRIRFVAR